MDTTANITSLIKNNTTEHEYFMQLALKEAKKAEKNGDVPVGAVIVKNGNIIAKGYNMREKCCDPSAHAEIIALRRAGKILGGWNLHDCTLYVTLEPCIMCIGASINARIKTIIFGAFDQKGGCCGSHADFSKNMGFNHEIEVAGGILKTECSSILTNFFKSKRKK